MQRDTEILLGDCLDLMQEIPDASVDAIITDPPYGCMDAHWDVAIDWQAWWAEIRRIRKPAAPTLVFCIGKFCGLLWSTNPSEYRYDWIWVKNEAANFLNCHSQPLKKHEKIFVFAGKAPKYNPQYVKGKPYHKGSCYVKSEIYSHRMRTEYTCNGDRYPDDVLYYPRQQGGHPTAKPVALCEYLIRTYTDEGDIVLDPFCGGGAVPVAALRTGRKCIGFEKDAEWYEYAKARVEKEAKQTKIEWW